MLPWAFEWESGVTNAVVALANECRSEAAYRPVALEVDWAANPPREDEWRGISRVRLRLRAPWSDRRPIWGIPSYLVHLPIDFYRLWKLIRRYDLRVINRQFPGLDAFGLVLMRRVGLFSGKNVFTFQGSDVRLVLNTRGITRWFWRLMLRSVDLLVFVSEGLKEEFLDFDPGLRSRSVVVHNGVDVEEFIRRSEAPVKSSSFSLSSPLILSIGGFEHRKGHDLLVEAFELVLQQRQDARLSIVGRTGPNLDVVRKIAAERGIEDRIALLTHTPYDHIPAFMRSADLFVLCSRWEKGKYGEGFPLVLAESGALARPVVSTCSTGCDEIIYDGETGRLVPLDNPVALAHAIIELLNNRDRASQMGMNLHKLVCEKFTWQHAWYKYRALVES